MHQDQELDRKIGAYIANAARTNQVFRMSLEIFLETRDITEARFYHMCRAKLPKLAEVMANQPTKPPGGGTLIYDLKQAPMKSDAELLVMFNEMFEGVRMAAIISMKLRGLL